MVEKLEQRRELFHKMIHDEEIYSGLVSDEARGALGKQELCATIWKVARNERLESDDDSRVFL